MDTTNLRTGVSAKPVLLDFVEEVQVKSSGYNAEYRATTGGVVSAVTKSGGNALPWRRRHLLLERRLARQRAAARFALNPANQTLAEYITTPRDPAYNMDPVLDFGGPMLHDQACGSISAMARRCRDPSAR